MSVQPTRTSRTEPLEDDELQHLITERIDEDPAFWTGGARRRTSITVEVEDGYVTLSGVVRTAMERRRADILARALGAAGVDNRLRVAEDKEKDPNKRRVA
jgi:BON domain-containing protein